ncbi:YeiH family protein [Arthrobacter mobilis]|uniref:YeiH family protein n=1 Tax=Arthrobacter mobilis TaxID=2724944 RepID=UPI001FE2C098
MPGLRPSLLPALLPGLAAAAAAVLLAFGAHAVWPAVPAMSFAVGLGILAANLPGLSAAVTGGLAPGLRFSAKTLMRAGIVLLGARLSLGELAGLGWQALVLTVLLVLAAFAGTYLLARLFRLPGEQPLLLAAGFAICGASAVAAVAAARGSRYRDAAAPVALVTLCGTLAIAVLPALMQPAGLTAQTFGFWVGASVHDVGQVVAAAQTAGPAALAVAVVVKLVRVAMLAPVVAAVTLHGRRARRCTAGNAAGGHAGPRPPVVPLFLAGFLAMVLLRSTGWLPLPVLFVLGILQDLLLAAALFALGASVRLRELAHSSLPALAAALLAWLLVAALGLAAAGLAGV